MIILTFFCILAITWTGYANNLLDNGGFEQRETGNSPAAWSITRSQASGNVELDAGNPASGSYSLRMQQTSPKGWIAANGIVTLPKPTSKPQKLSVSCQVTAENLRLGMLVLTAGTKKQPQKQWIQVQMWSGSFGWKTFGKTLEIQPGTEQITISVRTCAPGMMWVDDCKLQWEDADSSEDNLLKNGSLAGIPSKEKTLPDGWIHDSVDTLENISRITWRSINGTGEIELAYQSGLPRSIVSTESKTDLKIGSHYHFSADTRALSGGQAKLGITFYNKDGIKIEEIFSSPSVADTFQPLQRLFQVPENTASVKLNCIAEGNGKVVFRNASLKLSKTKSTEDTLSLEARCLPVEWTAACSRGKFEFNTFADVPLPLAFHFRGKKSELKNPALVVELPSGVELDAAYPTHAGYLGPEKFTSQKIQRSEGEYCQYRFEPRALALLMPTYAYERKLALLLKPSSPTFSGLAGRIFWHLENDGKKSREHFFDLQILSPLPHRKMPEKFNVFRWESADFLIPDNSRFDASADLLERCGIRSMNLLMGTGRSKEIRQRLEARNWHFNYSMVEYLHAKYIPEEIRRELGKKFEYVIRDNGQMNRELLCPEYFVQDSDFQNKFRTSLASQMAKTLKTGDLAVFDFEPFGTMQWCFCQRCRTAFAVEMHLKTIPSASEIKKGYPKQWVDFRCKNTAEQVRIYAEILRQAVPGVIIGDYDYIVDFRRPDYKAAYEHVAKNPQLNEQYIDLHMSSYYYTIDKRAFDMMRLSKEHLKKPIIPIFSLSGIDYISLADVLSPHQLRLMVLSAIFNECNGIALYPGMQLDGLFLRELSRGMYEAALLEPYLSNRSKGEKAFLKVEGRPYRVTEIPDGKQIQKFGFPRWNNYFAADMVQCGEKYLIGLFNFHPKEVVFCDLNPELPSGKYVVQNLFRNTLIPTRVGKIVWSAEELKEGILAEIPSTEAMFLLIRQETPSDAKLPHEPSHSEREHRFKEKSSNFGKAAVIRPIQQGTFSIRPVSDGKDGSLKLALTTPQQEMRISDSGTGIITTWKVNGVSILTGPDQLLSEDRIWLPAENRGLFAQSAKLTAIEIQNGELIVKQEMRNDTLSLTMYKEFRLAAETPRLTVHYKLESSGTRPQEILFWTRNLFSGGPSGAIFYSNDKNLESNSLEQVFPLREGTIHGFSPALLHEKAGAEIHAVSPGFQIKMINKPEKLMNYYSWRNSSIATWEWMSRPILLTPGKSWKSEVVYSVLRPGKKD